MVKDEYAIVLDFLPRGKPGDRKAEPVAQAIGEKFFNLLELAIREGAEVKPKERVYIGEEKRDKVKYIRGRISYNELTNFAKSELEEVLLEQITKDEKRFVNIFNKAGPISTRMHALELLPGIGKKHLWDIIRERKKKPFENFKELQERIEMLPDPKKMILKRILNELEGKDRHRLFVSVSFI
ncbi:MAG: DUF655 domain-containing protein [Candidatus Aenigmatarchaeota archaeon]